MASTSSTNNKRPQPEQHAPAQGKIRKIHPFFTKDLPPSTPNPFRWQSLGPKSTCFYAVNLDPHPFSSIAAFDLDGTIIKSNFGTRKTRDPTHWEWWRSEVPPRLRDLHRRGYSIVIISNQALRPAALRSWKQKIELFARSLLDVPFHLFAATQKDFYRKPMPGMWYELERIFREQSVEIDKTSSFFVGDAAGRNGDFAGTDRKWAMNVEIPFHTPEEYFLNSPPIPFVLEGFTVKSLSEPPQLSLTHIISSPRECEIVVFTGYPCLGKTRFYRQHFEEAGYIHVNQDALKSRDKCLKIARESIEAGKSCVIDNTNRDRNTRKLYVDLAKAKGVTIRCFVFEGSINLAWHNNLYRAYLDKEAKRDLVPYAGFISFRDNFEAPAHEEGFSSIRHVTWAFQGTCDEEKNWSMWLQMDGK